MSLLTRLGRSKQGSDSRQSASQPSDEEVLVNPFAHCEPDKDDLTPPVEGGLGIDPLPVDDDPELLAADKKESKLAALLNVLPKPGGGNGYPLLAFQAGSFGLRGVLVRNTLHGAVLGEMAESRKVDFTRAIAEVTGQLKQHQKRLPKNAILITPSVISSMVELPVSPLRPRADDEMEELIKWELEGTLSQQNKHWLIGSMLVERGYLTLSQRDELVEELKIRQSQGGQGSLLRFGDLAVQLQYINREQLEECFVLQGKLISVDDELAYGWQAEEPQLEQGLSDEILLSKEEDDDSAHKWLVCGMSKAVRRRWVGAFNLNGIKLQAFYPAIGSSFALLSGHSLDAEQAVLEVHQEQLAFISGHATSVQEIRVVERPQGSIRAEDLQQLLGILPRDLNRIYINAPQAEADELLFVLSTVTAVECEHLTLNRSENHTEDRDGNLYLGILGAADHFLEHVAPASLSWIAAKEREDSPFKKLFAPKVLKATAAVVVAAAMLGFLGWMHWNMWYQSNRLAELNERFEKGMALKKQFSAIVNEQVDLKSKIAFSRAEVASNSRLLTVLSEDRVREKQMARLLLKALSVVTPATVSIQSVKQKDNVVFISAIAHSNTDGQFFVNTLNRVIKPLAYEVIRSDVVRQEKDGMFVVELQLGLSAAGVEVVSG